MKKIFKFLFNLETQNPLVPIAAFVVLISIAFITATVINFIIN